MSFFESKTKYFVLTGVFLVALVISFLLAQQRKVTEGFVSSNLEPSTLPLVWTVMCDEKMNCMHGHVSDVGYDVAYDTLCLLPADRRMTLQVENTNQDILSMSYEVRDAELTQLMEKTVVTDYSRSGSVITADLTLQNLLSPETEYRLDFIIDTEEKGEIHYYSRIKISEDLELASEMLQVVKDFSARNFDYDLAKENTTYMETDGSADETNLAYTNLKSQFSNLAYNGLKLTPSANKDLRLCEYDDNTGEIHYSYIAVRDNDGTKEYYQIDETFILRQGTIRIYLMNYSRDIREIFVGSSNTLSGKRVTLGINDENDIEAMNTDDNNSTYIVSGGDLWRIDCEDGRVTSVFSFRSNNVDDVRNSYAKHDIHLLRTDGDVINFLVYGYMNRGVHEGETGISYMKYDPSTDISSEILFIPVDRSFEYIDYDMEQLAYLNSGDILYLKIGKNIYSVDTKSGSYVEIAANLDTYSLVINKDMDMMAWQSSNNVFGSETINVMDFESGEKKEIRAESGSALKLDGFIGSDIAIRVCSDNDKWIRNGKVNCVPAQAVEILNDNLDILKHYGESDTYIMDVAVHDGRLNMNLYAKNEDGSYKKKGEDTLVSSDEAPDRLEGIGSYQTEDKLKVFYVELPADVKVRRIKSTGAADIVINGIDVAGMSAGEDDIYAAYGDGKLIGIYSIPADAINMVYDRMGIVKHHAGLLYNRAATVTSRILARPYELAETVLDERENGELLDLTGITLKEALYFVSSKKPVLTWVDGERPVLIYAYDKSIITCHDLETGEIMYLGMEEAEKEIINAGSDFSCENH